MHHSFSALLQQVLDHASKSDRLQKVGEFRQFEAHFLAIRLKVGLGLTSLNTLQVKFDVLACLVLVQGGKRLKNVLQEGFLLLVKLPLLLDIDDINGAFEPSHSSQCRLLA